MKRLFNLFLCMLIVSTSLHADFKIMGGLNLSRYSVSPEEGNLNWNYKLGFLAGIGLEKKLNYKLLLEFDFLYFQKGSNVDSPSLPDSKWKYNLKAISIPVLLRFKFMDRTSPYVFGGVEISALVDHEVIYEGQEAIDVKEKTKSLDYGLVFGCGYEIELQEFLYFFVEGRYHLGLKNIISTPLEVESMKTNAILIIIGMRS